MRRIATRSKPDTSSTTRIARHATASGCRIPGSSFDLRGLHPNERPRFEASLLNGKGTQMPSWRGTLSETEIEQLWAYVRENAYD